MYITVQQFSARSGYRENYIRKLISLGKIKKTKKRGTGREISETELKKWSNVNYEIKEEKK